MNELSLELIRSAIKDDRQFRVLYNHYAPFVWRVVFRTVHGNSDIAEQVLQSVFVTVHRSLRKFNGKAQFSTWLYQIAWRESIRVLKRVKRDSARNVEYDDSSTAMDTKNKEQEEKLDEVLSILSPEERFLLVSRELDGFSFDELATITNRNSGTLRTQVSRIKDKVREVYHEKR